MNPKLPTSQKTEAVLVIGVGIAGIQAPLDLAESGYKVYLVMITQSTCTACDVLLHAAQEHRFVRHVVQEHQHQQGNHQGRRPGMWPSEGIVVQWGGQIIDGQPELNFEHQSENTTTRFESCRDARGIVRMQCRLTPAVPHPTRDLRFTCRADAPPYNHNRTYIYTSADADAHMDANASDYTHSHNHSNPYT